MPRQPGIVTNGSAARAGQSARVRPLCLLVTDPDPAVRQIVAQCPALQGAQFLQADTLAQARRKLVAQHVDLLLIEPNLPDGSGLALVQEIGRGTRQTHSVVLAAQISLPRAIEALRQGACDILVKPLNLAEVNERLTQAAQRVTAQQRSRQKVRRLRRMCRNLDRVQKDITQQIDTLCHDLVTAYEELANQMHKAVESSEYNAVVGQELDLEQFLRKVLEHVLEKVGPTNAAIFLPANVSEFSLGGYINYDYNNESPEFLLQQMADALVPQVIARQSVLHLTDNGALGQWLGAGAGGLDDCHLLAVPCRYQEETLAVLVLFRHSSQPFAPGMIEVFASLAPLLGESLARIIRIHHRHLPMDPEAGV